ncbi:MAG: ABC transporter permease subunit [Dehalococcoidia bacterium]|nr:ABC transporter permease subunit [Dehalococcoidia bacterium]
MNGLLEILRKELADSFNSKRFIILFLLVYLAGIATIYIAAQNIRAAVGDSTSNIFLSLFVVSGSDLPFSFPLFMSIFIPIIGIALGFDAINSERIGGNLSRVLAQPIYRDSLINGKFLSGLTMISVLIVSVVAIVAGLGLRLIGVPPEAEEILRLFMFVIVSILYGAFWMSLSVLFSVLFKKTSTSVLASIAVWIFMFLFMGIIANLIAGAAFPLSQDSTVAQVADYDNIFRMVSRISPGTLYAESIQAILLPMMGSTSPTMMMIGMYSGLMPSPLPLSQSLMLVWPQLVGLVALTAVCFTIAYVKFMREEIRST